MQSELKHIADVKVGSVRGKSRVYPQLRLPSQYADLTGKKAIVYEIGGNEDSTTFVIHVSEGLSYNDERSESQGHVVSATCGSHDAMRDFAD